MNPVPAIVAQAMESAGLQVNNHRLVETLRAALRSGQHAYKMVPSVLEEVLEERAWMNRRDSNGRLSRYEADQFEAFITDPEPDGLGITLEEMRRYLGGSENPLRVAFEGAIAKGHDNDGWKKKTRSSDGTFTVQLPNIIRKLDSESDATGSLSPKNSKSLTSNGSENPHLLDGHQVDPPPVHPDSDQDREEPPSDRVAVSREKPPARDRSREPQAGTSVGYLVRRLTREGKRDPNIQSLLDKVVAGEMTAHAAAVQAGFVTKPITIPSDPVAAARRLLRHFQGERLAQLIDELQAHCYADTN